MLPPLQNLPFGIEPSTIIIKLILHPDILIIIPADNLTIHTIQPPQLNEQIIKLTLNLFQIHLRHKLIILLIANLFNIHVDEL